MRVTPDLVVKEALAHGLSRDQAWQNLREQCPVPPWKEAELKAALTKGYRGRGRQQLEFQREPVEASGREYVLAPCDTYDGWFRRPGLHLAAGSSGTGKSTLLLELLCVQERGGRYFGHAGAGWRFLVICADRPRRAVEETLERMGLTGRVTMEHLPPSSPFAAAAAILELIERHDLPPVVFVEGGDLLVGDSNDPEGVSRFLGLLQEMADRYVLSLILSVGSPKCRPKEQYAQKRDRVLGTQTWARMAETIIVLAAGEDGSRELDVLHRNAPPEHYRLRFENGLLVVEDPEEARQAKIAQLEKDPLWRWLSRQSWFTRALAVTAMKPEGLQPNAVYKRLAKFMEDGLLELQYEVDGQTERLRVKPQPKPEY